MDKTKKSLDLIGWSKIKTGFLKEEC